MSDDQTIFAPASAVGKAGLSVFRVSGTQAREAITRLCEPAEIPPPRHASLRTIKHPQSAEIIDRALVLSFPAPHSFTGEDVVEFHTHGGKAVAQAMLEALGKLSGFRLAEPGEFTRRGFENGKMDLTEAEAITDLIHAETEAQRKQALRQLDGALGKIYEDWRGRLARGLAYMEAAIDFSDEELPPDLLDRQTESLRLLRDEIVAHLNDNHRGERLREGFAIAILGAPNAGKSSLLNALARREVAIVSPTAGTTRDVVEVHLDIGGYPVMLADTAGLRETSDAIESEGVRRAQARAQQVDLKLLVFDGTLWPHKDAATSMLIDSEALIVVNKADLIPTARSPNLTKSLVSAATGAAAAYAAEGHKFCSEHPKESKFMTLGMSATNAAEGALALSALTGEGIDALLERLGQEIKQRFDSQGVPPLTRARHRAALQEAVDHLDRALQAPMADLRAEDVRLAMRALGRITGRVDVEDLLDIIFRDFCIGK